MRGDDEAVSLSIIIPSRNESNLRACVSAIQAAGESCNIIVVWDDWALSVLWHREYGDGWFVPGIQPFSWPRNVNLGIMSAGEDDVVIMGDDALLKTPLGLSKMRSAMAARPHLGVLAASSNGVGNGNQRPAASAMLGQVRPEPRMLCFITVMIPRAVINAVGLLDQRFNSYACADDDYSLRVRKAGYTLGVFDGCLVDHESLPSTFRAPGMDSSLEHGRRMFLEKWGVSNDEA